MNDKEIKLLFDYVKKRYNEVGMDYKTFDTHAEVDTDLSYMEQKNIFDEKLATLLPPVISKKEINEAKEQERKQKELMEAQFKAEQERQEAELRAKQEEELERIRNIPTSAEQEKIYGEMDGLISQTILNANTRGLIIDGASSLGKTFRVKKRLDSLGKVEGKDYLIHSGHTTTLRLYIKLHNHSDKIHIFDDVNILENKTNLNLLKAMLNGNTHGIVEYDTTKKLPDGVQDKFIFTGKVIVLLNELPRNTEHFRAVESRVLTYHLKMSREEILKVLYERAKREEIEGITKQERLEIVDWLKENTSKATTNLNYRLYEKALHLYAQDKTKWKDLTITQVSQSDKYTELVITGLDVKNWCEQTGGHKSTYYRIKERLGQ